MSFFIASNKYTDVVGYSQQIKDKDNPCSFQNYTRPQLSPDASDLHHKLSKPMVLHQIPRHGYVRDHPDHAINHVNVVGMSVSSFVGEYALNEATSGDIACVCGESHLNLLIKTGQRDDGSGGINEDRRFVSPSDLASSFSAPSEDMAVYLENVMRLRQHERRNPASIGRHTLAKEIARGFLMIHIRQMMHLRIKS